MTAAEKPGAEAIYTWDVSDFERDALSPCLKKIHTPAYYLP
jgi:hypothetical protein